MAFFKNQDEQILAEAKRVQDAMRINQEIAQGGAMSVTPGAMSTEYPKENTVGMSYATKPVTSTTTQTVNQPKKDLTIASAPEINPTSGATKPMVTYTGNQVMVYKDGKSRMIDSAMLPSFEKAGFTTTNQTGEISGTEEETNKDIYGYIPETNTEYEDAMTKYKKSLLGEDLTEEQIKQKVTDRFQAQIDALDRYYATQVAREQQAGEGRLGSGAAI